ncbi:hypothetical protein Tco_1236223 [Tanacetum coccineum]
MTSTLMWKIHFPADFRSSVDFDSDPPEYLLYLEESDHDDCVRGEDIYVLEQLLNDDPFQLPPMDLKQSEVTKAKSSIEEPPELELKDLPSHLELPFLEEMISHKISKSGIEVDRAKVDVIDIQILIDYSQEEADEAPILVVPDWNLLSNLCVIASVLRLVAVLGLLIIGKLQLNELNELRDQAYENSLIYKEKTKKLHDSKIKNRIFNVGDQVLLFNSRLKIFSGKLKTRWSGPFTITQVFPFGIVELSQPRWPNFKVNGHRVKHYFGGDIPPKVVPDLHTLPKDN